MKDQIKYLTCGNVEILPHGIVALEAKLKKNRPLRVKLGIDPTSPDLHLGHTVCLQILKRFQDLGHIPILIIGGFTAQLGDPTGRNEARPPLSEEDVKKNSETYLEQVAKILDINKIEIVNNNAWLRDMKLAEILKLMSLNTVNQIIAKEAFGERLDKGFPLYMHEILYPILQAYDSVQVKADIEIGGQDQRFNVLAGREMQKHFGQEEQIVMLAPLLIGLDGKKKMSKSFGNYIGVFEAANEMYGKTMSLADEQMLSWYCQLLNILPENLKENQNPRDLKMQLAREIIKIYHSEEKALEAEQDFIKRFQKREIPEDIKEFSDFNEEHTLAQIMHLSGMCESIGEAKRKIKEGAVKLNNEKLLEEFKSINLKTGDILQLGKRKFIKIKKIEN